jgi:DNA-binding LacI/PurR family transcriptional regulator
MTRYSNPALTTINVFKRELGFEAGKRLLQLLKGVASQPVKIVVSTKLVVRESTGEAPSF